MASRMSPSGSCCGATPSPVNEREIFIDNLLVRIHFIIVMIRWTGLAPWEFEFPFPREQEEPQWIVLWCHAITCQESDQFHEIPRVVPRAVQTHNEITRPPN